MSKQIHGHEVMEMMVASKKSYTKESLEQDIDKEFGADARFYTCSKENMTAKELISLLESRGKFADAGDGFSVTPDKICDH